MKKYMLGLFVAIIFLFSCGFNSEEQKVYDNANLLTEAQENTLQEECVRIAEEKKLDIVIVTTTDTEGKSSLVYSDDFYDEHNFGFDKQKGTGILLLINIQNNEVWIDPAEGAIKYFNYARIETIVSEMTPSLSSGDYSSGMFTFLGDVEQYMGVNPNPVVRALKNVIVQILVAGVLGGIALLIMLGGQRSKVTINDRTYLKDHQIDMHNQQDLYIRTTTVTRKIETNNGGGGGAHISGGGVSHGGGGGKF